MGKQFRSFHRWVRFLVLVALVGGSAAVAPPAGAQEPAGYDIGLAGKPAPTGKVREFHLVVEETSWELVSGVYVPAITYNGRAPGPEIRVTEGDTVRVVVENKSKQATSIHWHGLHVPYTMDGVTPFSQAPIEPGATFIYEFAASHAGTFMYHSHHNTVEQIDHGLYGPFIIEPATAPATKFDREFVMVLSAWNSNQPLSTESGEAMAGMAMPDAPQGATKDQAAGGMSMDYNYFTINGKAFPDAPPWTVRENDLVRVRLINISNLAHPMHVHGHDFTVIAKDGEPIRPDRQQTMNTLSIDAGETYDIALRADNPGVWIFHCHELHHTENDGVEPGGLMQVIQYEGFESVAKAHAAPLPGAAVTTPAGETPAVTRKALLRQMQEMLIMMQKMLDVYTSRYGHGLPVSKSVRG